MSAGRNRGMRSVRCGRYILSVYYLAPLRVRDERIWGDQGAVVTCLWAVAHQYEDAHQCDVYSRHHESGRVNHEGCRSRHMMYAWEGLDREHNSGSSDTDGRIMMAATNVDNEGPAPGDNDVTACGWLASSTRPAASDQHPLMMAFSRPDFAFETSSCPLAR